VTMEQTTAPASGVQRMLHDAKHTPTTTLRLTLVQATHAARGVTSPQPQPATVSRPGHGAAAIDRALGVGLGGNGPSRPSVRSRSVLS